MNAILAMTLVCLGSAAALFLVRGLARNGVDGILYRAGAVLFAAGDAWKFFRERRAENFARLVTEA